MQVQKRVLLILVLLCGLGSSLPAQQDWTWTFGDSVVMHFPGGGAPVVDTVEKSAYSLEGGTTMSNPDGSLRWYVANGYLWRGHGYTIPQSSPIGFPDLTNPYIPLTVWGDTTDYLIFVVDGRCGVPLYCPWLVEVKGVQGHDTVVVFRSLGEYHPTHPLAEKVAAVRDASGTGWWVLYHGILDNAFVKFKVDGDQVSPLDTQMIGTPHVQVGQNPYPDVGEICFSPQGNRLMVVSETGIIDLFDFDRCSGELSNWIPLGTPAPNVPGPNTYYGCSFSNDGTKIYVSEGGNGLVGDRLFQFDLSAGNVPASKTLIFTYPDSVAIGQHQLGPDGKIYITQIHWRYWDTTNVNHRYLSVINDPNQTGLACSFGYQQLYLEGMYSTLNLPNLPNFNLPPLVAQVAEAGPPSVTICPGDSLQIGYPDSTGGSVTYAWAAHPDIADTTLPQLWVQPTQSTWYYLSAVDSGFGLPCGKTRDSIHVILATSAQFPVAIAGNDTTICPGDTISLMGSANVGAWKYHWSGGSWIASPDSAQTLVTGAGLYALVVRNPAFVGSCFADTDYVVVDTVAMPRIPHLPDSIICRGDSLQLGATLLPNWVGAWSPSGGLVWPDSVHTMARPVVTTTYVLAANDTTSLLTCAFIGDTVLITVEIPFVHPAPESQEFCPGEVLTVGIQRVSGFSYAWTPIAGLNDPFASSTTVAPETAILYTLAITSDTMVSENCRTQYFPVALTTDGCIDQNVVTPNGDGINDFLRLGSFNGPISLSVYDRWGALVYSSNDYRGDWPRQDGRLPESVYWYVVNVAGEGGKAFVGEVTVVR